MNSFDRLEREKNEIALSGMQNHTENERLNKRAPLAIMIGAVLTGVIVVSWAMFVFK